MKNAWENAVESAIKANDYLKGDDCESSEQFLVGWAWSNYRALTGHAPGAVEAGCMRLRIREFLERV